MGSQFSIYHNPRCRKSREALQELESNGCEIKIVEYLKDPVSAAELKKVCDKLGLEPEDIVRKSEELYKTKYKGENLTAQQWFKVLAENPVLIERPIVIKENKAVIAREPGVLKKFLK